MKFQALILDKADNVAVLLDDALKGTVIRTGGKKEQEILLTEAIRFGHKTAVENIAQGDIIKKYGRPIGRATKNILAGEHVHIHNVCGLRANSGQEKGE